MAPTTTQGRRRRRSTNRPPTSQSRAAELGEPSLQRVKEQSRKRKMAWVEEENVARRNTGDMDEVAAASASAVRAAAEEASSADSSPLRLPWRHIDDWRGSVMAPFSDPAIDDAYSELLMKYHAKKERHRKLPTLGMYDGPLSCLSARKLLPVRESATKIVLQAAKAVFGLSSYIDGKPLKRSSGFLIDWDKESKAGTILTSALLIRSKSSSEEWLGADEFAPDAEVRVHLLDEHDTTAVACLLHYDKHFNLALFMIDMDVPAHILDFSSEMVLAQEVFVLGRNESQYLNIKHGSIQYEGPTSYRRHHYMYIDCVIGEYGIGGPVIDFNGQALGMANILGTGFIPSSIILRCFEMWKKFHCIPRLHIGMKFTAIKLLDPAFIEKISRKCNVDAGLIVIEVSEGSFAEKLGIRIGDVIESLSGEYVSTTVELENLLLRLSEEHLDKGNYINSNVDVPVGIFRTRKGSRCTMKLPGSVSDDVEVIATGMNLLNRKANNKCIWVQVRILPLLEVDGDILLEGRRHLVEHARLRLVDN